jgi:hypothetical protein
MPYPRKWGMKPTLPLLKSHSAFALHGCPLLLSPRQRRVLSATNRNCFFSLSLESLGCLEFRRDRDIAPYHRQHSVYSVYSVVQFTHSTRSTRSTRLKSLTRNNSKLTFRPFGRFFASLTHLYQRSFIAHHDIADFPCPPSA